MTEPAQMPDLSPVEVAPPAEASIAHISVRTAVILVIFTLIFTALMAATYFATKPAIDASAREEKLKLIGEVLPKSSYDNDLLADAVALPPVAKLGLDETSQIYRARLNGHPVALVVEAAAPDGYSGRIGLVLAVDMEGHLLAVRVTGHKETPGLGDYIDPKKDKNKTRPWITQFNDIGFDAVLGGHWKVKKDGGRFDAPTGATISARAVTNATGRALSWIADRRDKLVALPANATYKE